MKAEAATIKMKHEKEDGDYEVTVGSDAVQSAVPAYRTVVGIV